MLDAGRNLAGRQQVRGREAGSEGDPAQEPVEIMAASAEAVAPLHPLAAGFQNSVHKLALSENPLIPVEAVAEAATCREDRPAPALRIKPPPVNSGRRPCATPSATKVRYARRATAGRALK